MQIDKKIDDNTIECYLFTQFDSTFVFTRYYKKVREGKRKWVIVNNWDKYNKRDSNTEEPILDNDILYYAEESAKSLIKIKTWHEYKNIN
jgi:hypothetical protein